VVAGTLSTVDMRPVQTNTRFRLTGLTPGIAALAMVRTLHSLALQANINIRIGREAKCPLFSDLESVLLTPVSKVWPDFGGGHSAVTLANVLSHSAGLHNAYPKDFPLHLLDEPGMMASHFELCSLPMAREVRYAYLLNSFVLAKLAHCVAGKESLLQLLQDELGPLGLDIARPGVGSGSAQVCRDIPADAFDQAVAAGELAATSHHEQEKKHLQDLRAKAGLEGEASMGSRGSGFSAASLTSGLNGAKRPLLPDAGMHSRSMPAMTAVVAAAASADESSEIVSLAKAMAANPVVFDPLFANCQGESFRAGLSLSASARGLARTLASKALQADLKALGALRPMGTDSSGLGWTLNGGACRWSAGGLQVVRLRACSLRARFSRAQEGFGVFSGFGTCVVHFPGLAPGGLTVAVNVNDATWGQEASSQVLAEVLAVYGYAPAWTSMPVRVMMDIASNVAHLGKAHLPRMAQGLGMRLRARLATRLSSLRAGTCCARRPSTRGRA